MYGILLNLVTAGQVENVFYDTWQVSLTYCGECNQSSGRSRTAWRAEDVEKETGGHVFDDYIVQI